MTEYIYNYTPEEAPLDKDAAERLIRALQKSTKAIKKLCAILNELKEDKICQ